MHWGDWSRGELVARTHLACDANKIHFMLPKVKLTASRIPNCSRIRAPLETGTTQTLPLVAGRRKGYDTKRDSHHMQPIITASLHRLPDCPSPSNGTSSSVCWMAERKPKNQHFPRQAHHKFWRLYHTFLHTTIPISAFFRT